MRNECHGLPEAASAYGVKIQTVSMKLLHRAYNLRASKTSAVFSFPWEEKP
jgi:hypothetical protein